MLCHLIEGEPGCILARQAGHVAVVVDALRASATAASLLQAGASDLVLVREVEDAYAVRRARPEVLLFGERGGLPPEGFDGGNSPRDTGMATGRDVVFTTTTGVQRMADAWGARALFMGTTMNAQRVAAAAIEAARARSDIVLIPAGLASDPAFDAQEDWVGATVVARKIAAMTDCKIGEGRTLFERWAGLIDREGVERLFAQAPHAEKLRRVGLEIDIAYCAQVDVLESVPEAMERVAGPGFSGIRVIAHR